MENKINIAELLKDCPKGMELDCTLYENVTLIKIREGYDYPIVIETPNGQMLLSKYGCFSKNELAKCIIFPKGKTTWEGFQRPFKDGDVVVAEDSESFQLFLLKHLTHSEDDNDHNGYCYFGWDFQFNSLFQKGYWGFNRLATEEEKAKLFQAIKDNGYKWNEETKTLEKLIEPKFKVGDKVQRKEDIREKNIIDNVLNNCYTVQGHGVIFFTDQDEWELAPNKFDITTLKPFESKVLVRNFDSDYWKPAIFGFTGKDKNAPFYVEGGNFFNKCIPYEGNEHLLGKTDNCDDFYKIW